MVAAAGSARSLGAPAAGRPGSSGSRRPGSAGGAAVAGEEAEPPTGVRWTGKPCVEIHPQLIGQCTEGDEAGRPTDLNFHFQFLRRITGLEKAAQALRHLDLSANNIRIIEGLKMMPKLRDLRLDCCQISRIQGLEECPSLASLHLGSNRLSAVEGLDHLRSTLEYLNLDSNRIRSLGQGLARLAKLRELHINRNCLVSLEGLAGLGSIETLQAEFNCLTEVLPAHILGLDKLDELHLTGNQLESLAFLVNTDKRPGSSLLTLPSLAMLYVSQNRLTMEAIRGIPTLSQLSELHIAENRLQGLHDNFAAKFQALEILDLSKNELVGAEDVERLQKLPMLKELGLSENPCVSDPELRERFQKALDAMPQLEYLDDTRFLRRPPTVSEEDDDEGVDLDRTFRLTASKLGGGGGRGEQPAAQAAGGVGSRPATSSSRPSTSKSHDELAALSGDPLMHLRVKLAERPCASADQVMQWEKKTLDSLAAVERQVTKTVKASEAELQQMKDYLSRADKVLEKERELQAKRAEEEAARLRREPKIPMLRAALAHGAAAEDSLLSPVAEEGPAPLTPAAMASPQASAPLGQEFALPSPGSAAGFSAAARPLEVEGSDMDAEADEVPTPPESLCSPLGASATLLRGCDEEVHAADVAGSSEEDVEDGVPEAPSLAPSEPTPGLEQKGIGKKVELRVEKRGTRRGLSQRK